MCKRTLHAHALQTDSIPMSAATSQTSANGQARDPRILLFINRGTSKRKPKHENTEKVLGKICSPFVALADPVYRLEPPTHRGGGMCKVQGSGVHWQVL